MKGRITELAEPIPSKLVLPSRRSMFSLVQLHDSAHLFWSITCFLIFLMEQPASTNSVDCRRLWMHRVMMRLKVNGVTKSLAPATDSFVQIDPTCLQASDNLLLQKHFLGPDGKLFLHNQAVVAE